MFYDNDRRGLPTTHNRPLYVTASVNGVEDKRVMLDTSCSINIIFLLTLDVIGIPRDKIVRQPMEVSSFRGHKTFTIGFVNLVLTVGPIRVAHPFQAIDLCMSYHVLLGRSWIHRNKTVPSTYHQWKRIHINATESSFQREGKVAPARP